MTSNSVKSMGKKANSFNFSDDFNFYVREIGKQKSIKRESWMAHVIACGEPSLLPTHIAFLRYLNRTLDSIKHDVAQVLGSIFFSQPNIERNDRNFFEEDTLSSAKDLMIAMGSECSLEAQYWSSREKNFGDKQGPYAVFNALDTMLKDSLDRLKMMREGISLVKVSLQGYTCHYNCTEHAALIRCLCLEGKLGAGLWLRRKMMQKGVLPDVFTHNYLINGLCKIGLMEKADWLIREMIEMGPSPNRVTYNTFIKGYCLINNIDKALYLFSTMGNVGIQPNRVTCNTLVHALCKKGLLKEANKLLEEILNDDDDKNVPDLVTSTIFMDDYFKNGSIIQGLSLWDEMLQKGRKVDVIAYNVLIHGFCMSQEINLAYGYACEMLKKGLLPDVFTYNTLIGALCKEGNIIDAFYIFGVMSKMGVMPDQISYKIMIQGSCFNGDVHKAKKLLLCMLDNSMVPNPLIWNVIIDCYGRCGDLKSAFCLRDLMLAFGVLPNVYTYNAIIHALVNSGNIYRAYSLKEDMISKGLCPDVVTYNLLIGAACDLGYLHLALHLHDEMLQRGYEPDIITYTELIRGHCMRGNMKEAEEIFAKIQKCGLLNDHVPVQILFNKYCKLEEPVMAFNLYQEWLTSKQDSHLF